MLTTDYGGIIYNNASICSCCGSSYTRSRPKKLSTGRGIRVYEGIVGKAYSGKKNEIAHVKTRNGDVTIAIRKEW